MSNNGTYAIADKVPIGKAITYSLQHLMAFVGGGAIVPALIMGLDPALAVFCTGLGTIIYLLCTKNQVPSYFGVSFSFITPMAVVTAVDGISGALCGIVAVGIVFCIVAGIVKLVGTGWIDKVLPPVVAGCIIVVIGVGLSATAINMVMFDSGASEGFDSVGCAIGLLTFLVAVACSSYFKGFMKMIPVLVGIVVGYVASIPLGLVDFAAVREAAWVGMPNITLPTFSMNGILVIAPIALVVIVEHIGHLLTVTNITGENCNDKLAASLLGNGLGTAVAGCIGGPALTSIAENIGVMGLSKCYSTRVFWWTAGFALLIGGFCPKLAMLFYSIPNPVLGGASLLLFGLIAGNGLSLMVDARVDFTQNRNLMIAASSLIVGIGMMTMGVSIPLGSFNIPGLLLASILAIVLNLILPADKDENAANA
ncbi:uracil-xanthine permease family protein [Slackia exigua]|uniref:uracil-xanthine permease family protein n=1 Tax=Slackia exigua TaxID=84109 RepID=UPI00200317F1|nr:solute carrier family 23 protein [Slackia exigua]MCK6139967.1 NCS2 family nucleobase:cation symporter [Slackia exigua]